MFIIDLIYKAPLEKIDAHMHEHVKFLDKYYKAGNFILSGRKKPRTGGIILATAKNKTALNRIIKLDPFYLHQLADFTITEFNASQKAKNIDELLAKHDDNK